MTLLVTGFVLGCAGSPSPKNPQEDVSFDKWRVMAEQARGHSPIVEPRHIDLPENPNHPAMKRDLEEAAIVPKALPSQKVSLRMHNAELSVVLRALARAVNVSILINDKVKGQVSIDVEGVPWGEAFEGLLRVQGLGYTWEGEIIRVLTVEDMEQDLKIESIQEKQKALRMGSRLVESPLTRIIPIHYADAGKLKENLETFLTRDDQGKARGAIMVDGHTNSLIIHAIREDMARVIPLIEQLDKPTSQILIEANIVEATREVARLLGIQWGGFFHDGKTFVTPGGTGGTVEGNTLFYSPLTGTTGISGQGFGVNFPVDVAAGGGALGLMFGTIQGNILDAQLSALQTEGKVNILSSPSITTLDHKEAFTESGAKVPFVSIDEDGEQEVKFEEAVLRLQITPHVIDGKYLKMEIIVKKDEPDFTRQVLGNPLIIKKQTATVLIARDGETIVISGLTKERKSELDKGIPGLKDAPILGRLFKSQEKETSLEDLLIFITPHILKARQPGESAGIDAQTGMEPRRSSAFAAPAPPLESPPRLDDAPKEHINRAKPALETHPQTGRSTGSVVPETAPVGAPGGSSISAASPEAKSPGEPWQSAPGGPGRYVVQVGSFKEERNAEELRQKMEQMGFGGSIVLRTDAVFGRLYMVQTTPVAAMKEAEELVVRIRNAMHLTPSVVEVGDGQ